MIVDPPDIPAALVAAAVEREWGADVAGFEPGDASFQGWHWLLCDEAGPQWSARLECARTPEEYRTRSATLAAAADLALRLSFVCGPARTRDARVAVCVAPGILLSVTPYLDGCAVGTGPLTDDEHRGVVANMMGDLHRQPRPRSLPVWRPRIGDARAGRDELDRVLEREAWSGGPWSVPAGRLVLDARPMLRRAMRRFSLLGAAVTGNLGPWVVTHGSPDAAHLVRTPDGHRLVGWAGLALAPRERDLGEALGEAEGTEPWYSYLEAGGSPDPLSADTVELFALERHLSRIAGHAVLLAGPHEDDADGCQRFGELEGELAALLERWS